MLTNPIALRRCEATALFVLGLIVYHQADYSWLTFALLFFLPDAGAIGYFISHRVGGTAYNLTHWLIWPITLGAYGFWNDIETAKIVATIWVTHIAFDRMLGWGFKTGETWYHTDMGLKRAIGNQ